MCHKTVNSIMTDKFTILFYLWNNRLNRHGKAPIMVRISYRGKRKQFSSGHSIEPHRWISGEATIPELDADNDYIHSNLLLIQDKLNRTYLQLQLEGHDFSVEDIYTRFQRKDIQEDYSLLWLFEQYNQRTKKLVGIEIKQVTYEKFVQAANHLRRFIPFKYGKKDYPLKELKREFLEEFDYYLKTELYFRQNSINKLIQRTRKAVDFALIQGYIHRNPFLGFRPKSYSKEVVFLPEKELTLLREYPFADDRLALIRDFFVFCSYTGLAYHEMSELRYEHIQKGFDGKEWIMMKREKTGKPISIPLLPIASEIIERYRDERRGYVLPHYCNQVINRYLKEIASIVGIRKNLTHHIARKTFASTVLLYNDVPMEIVSKLLGHASVKTTEQYYSKVVQSKVSQVMADLGNKLSKKR